MERTISSQCRKRELRDAEELAKRRFGKTTFESEKERSRSKRLQDVKKDHMPHINQFVRRAPYNLVVNLLAALLQVFLIVTVMIGRDGSVDRKPRLQVATSLLGQALLGVFCTVSNLVCYISLLATIKVPRL